MDITRTHIKKGIVHDYFSGSGHKVSRSVIVVNGWIYGTGQDRRMRFCSDIRARKHGISASGPQHIRHVRRHWGYYPTQERGSDWQSVRYANASGGPRFTRCVILAEKTLLSSPPGGVRLLYSSPCTTNPSQHVYDECWIIDFSLIRGLVCRSALLLW